MPCPRSATGAVAGLGDTSGKGPSIFSSACPDEHIFRFVSYFAILQLFKSSCFSLPEVHCVCPGVARSRSLLL